MKEDATSLSRLNDLVEPPSVAWWPPAPGWYFVLAILGGVLAWLAYREWSRWRADVYRRAARHELQSAGSVAAISEVLRRTALAATSRQAIAGLSGPAWPAWLAERSPDPFPENLRLALASDVYREQEAPTDLDALREGATHWVRRHNAGEQAKD